VVTGNDGSTVEDRVTVDVANVIPNAWGGQVTSKDGRVVLTVPEQALLDSFRLILIEAEKKKQLASPPERQTVGNIYRVREPGEQFTKEALLRMTYDKEEIGDIPPNQIGIYGQNLKTKEWEYIDSTRDEQNHFISARVRKLHAYYTLMNSKTAGEGSAEISESQKTTHNQQAYTIPAHGQTLVSNTFEDGLGQWSNRDNEVGATIILNSSVTNDGSLAAKIVNTHVGGNFAVNVINTPFDVRTYPIVQFDYRIPAGVKTNFLVKVSGRWYEIGFTDDVKVLWDKRVNIGHIGDIQGVKSDGQWHTVQFNLYEMVMTKTRHTVIDEMIMADWDVTGYMKLVYGQNKKGSTYYIDNFTIRKDTSAGIQMDQDILVVDDFNKRKAQNALGGNSLLFYSSDSSYIEKQFEEKSKQGYSLKLKYKLNGKLGYVGYLSNLLNLDLWQYQVLSIKLKADKSSANQDFVLGIKDRAGNQCKIQIGSFVSGGITDEWKTAVIPLVAFEGIKDWGHIENISLSFERRLSQNGTIYVDDIEFQKHVQVFPIDDFERLDRKNRLLREHRTFAGGVAAINGQHAKASVNTVYRLSYGGIIGVGNIHDKNMKSFSGWVTYLGGIDCSNCDALSFKIRGFQGNEKFTVYLNDGTFQWGITVGNKAAITIEWQEVVIPLKEYSEYGIDLSNITEIRFGFEGEKTSGAIDLDDIQFTTIND
jgi:hypothetical protein